MNADLTPDLCVEVAEALALPHPGLVEKDYHVVRALQALAAVEHVGARLVFGGGTSLCRAYRLIERMSEDIDLRISSPTSLTTGERRRFRTAVTESLNAAGFNTVDSTVHDGGKTFIYNLPYTPSSAKVTSLRPGVRVEISSWPLLLASAPVAVSSFVAEATGEAAEVSSIQCVDVAETAADKFVALTRRIGEEHCRQLPRDNALLRHIYDLYRIRPKLDLNQVRPLLHTTMENDRQTRSKKFPAYAENPQEVSHSVIRMLENDPSYHEAFAGFQRDMVYGAHVEMHDCLPVLDELAALL